MLPCRAVAVLTDRQITAAATLARLLRLVLLVSMVASTFAQAFSFLALDIYGGAGGDVHRQLKHAGPLLSDGEGPTLLKVLSAYLLLLAVNGMTECFMFAVRYA